MSIWSRVRAYLPFNKHKLYEKLAKLEQGNKDLQRELFAFKEDSINRLSLALYEQEKARKNDIAYQTDFYNLRDWMLRDSEEMATRLQNIIEQMSDIRSSHPDLTFKINALEHSAESVNQNINRLRLEMENYKNQFRLMFWQLYRQDHETSLEAKKRFFLSLPKNDGDIRVLQVLEKKLLEALDEICQSHGLEYWLWGGSLLGSVRHQGFIPWDDDVDLGMLRSDMDKLMDILKDHEEYEIKVKYDAYVFCKQIRFKYRDDKNPVFIDIFVFDFCNNEDQQAEARKLAIKEELYKELGDATNPKIQEFYEAGLVDEASELGMYIKGIFDKYIVKGFEEKCMLHTGDSIIYGLENYQPQKSYANIKDIYIPTKRGIFEEKYYNIPNEEETVLKQIYHTVFDFPNGTPHFVHININEESIEYLKAKFNII